MAVKRMQQRSGDGANQTLSSAKREIAKLCAFTLSTILPIAVGAEGFATASSARAISYEDLIGIVDLGVADGQMDCGKLSISPDGGYVAIQTRQAHSDTNTTEIRWRVVPILGGGIAADIGDGGAPIEFFTNGYRNGASIKENAQWSPDSQWIAYRAGHKGKIELRLSRKDGSARETLPGNPTDIQTFRWSPDGLRIFFTTAESDVDTSDAHNEAATGYYYDGRFIPVLSTRPIQDTSNQRLDAKGLRLYDLETRTERAASAREQDEYGLLLNGSVPDCFAKASRGRVSAWLERINGNKDVGLEQPFTVVASKGARGSRPTVCLPHECTGYIRGIWIDDAGTTVFFLRFTGERPYGSMGLYRWIIGSATVDEVLRTEDLLEGCTRVAVELICGHSSTTRPTELVRLDLGTGVITTLYDPNPHFRSILFGETTSLSWKDDAGVPGFGHLVKPVGYVPGRRYPLIVVQYRSRGFLRGGTGDEYPIHVFAANGFAVLSFSRPEDWDSLALAKSYEEAKAMGSVDEKDRRRVLSVLEAGIDELDREGIIDPHRVGITGMSDGAETANFALVNAPQRFAAAAVSSDWCNPLIYYLLGPKYQEELRRTLHLEDPMLPGSAAKWQRMSVSVGASKVLTPLLIQVADSELLPATQAFTELREFGKPAEMYVFPDEFHVKSQPVHRLSMYRRSVQWFQFWLQGIEDPNPINQGQYARWRSMRETAGHRSGQ
jgi:dipeptidyl aminopeptidase/acylaminoacyl peptidase